MSTRLKNATINDLLRTLKGIKKLKAASSVISFPYLGQPSSWKIILFSDASHGNLCNGNGSMGGHIIFLVGLNRKCCVLSWQANKIKRVVRSTIAAEALSLQEGLDDAMFQQSTLNEIIRKSIPIDAYIDNKSVVEAIHSTKLVDDRRLRIDLASIKEMLRKQEV